VPHPWRHTGTGYAVCAILPEQGKLVTLRIQGS
jgi:hypothetical protein